jgi:hypothetical protein
VRAADASEPELAANLGILIFPASLIRGNRAGAILHGTPSVCGLCTGADAARGPSSEDYAYVCSLHLSVHYGARECGLEQISKCWPKGHTNVRLRLFT